MNQGPPRFKSSKELLAAAEQLASPYDSEARYTQKRETGWVGYKVHFTETCDADTPHLRVHVETTSSTSVRTAGSASRSGHDGSSRGGNPGSEHSTERIE